MDKLKDILYGVNILEVLGNTNVKVKHICFDSREAKKDSLFVAVRGTQTDGHRFISQVVDSGATVIICEEFPEELNKSGSKNAAIEPSPAERGGGEAIKKEIFRPAHKSVVYVKVKDCSMALSIIASNFYDEPSKKLKLIGVTGTNGKTTVVTLLYNLFRGLGHKAGLLSTVKNQLNDKVIPATHTTPDAIQLNKLLAEMVKQGCAYCFMEVSSHAIVQHRTAGLHFTGAVFTNISHDHLDYHKTFPEYIAAKKKLFDDLPSTAFALINADDKRGRVMVQNTKAKVSSFSLKRPADYRLKILENTFDGLVLTIEEQEVYSMLIGEFNAYNLLTVYAITSLLDIEKIPALQAISKLNAAEGRFEYFITPKKKIVGIVDYAHTPDALKKVLATVKTIRTGNEQVITIVGCGGNRDKKKRSIMAQVACELSNRIVLTSDNPRNEDPAEIIREMEVGVNPVCKRKVLSIVDRKEAIKTACSIAESGDIILLAGKGHEKYQEINGEKFPFDDRKLLEENLTLFDE